MSRIRQTHPLRRAVCHEVHTLRHADQIEAIARNPHLARDVGLDARPTPTRRCLPWILPF